MKRARRMKSSARNHRGVKCPNCLTLERPYPIKYALPWYLTPLRLFVGRVRCDACLLTFHRIRFFGWLVRCR
jgi:hypothetical protein